MNEELKALISKLGVPTRLQGTEAEYTLIAETILGLENPNVLVFGCGMDTELWQKCNPNGKNVYLEHNATWLQDAIRFNPGADIRVQDYTTSAKHWKNYSEEELILKMDQDLIDTEWDVIFIDGPHGWRDKKGLNPGRMSPIMMVGTSRLKCKNLFVHDCNRIIEKNFMNRYFKDRYESLDRTFFIKNLNNF